MSIFPFWTVLGSILDLVLRLVLDPVLGSVLDPVLGSVLGPKSSYPLKVHTHWPPVEGKRSHSAAQGSDTLNADRLTCVMACGPR